MTESAKQLRKTVLHMAYAGQDANLQSIFSSVEILRVLYDRCLNIVPGIESSPTRDRFILSKGQSTMGLLAILAEKGFIPQKELSTACRYDSRISMQADRTKLPDVEISAGSLGHGFPIAAGMAWGNRISDSPGRIYVLAGDGEMNEGTMWEAAIFSASEKLDNLTLIIDDNGSIQKMVAMGDLAEKLAVFGFQTITVNGHSEDELERAIKMDHTGRPLAVIAKTQRGYGSRTLMEDPSWFHRAPTEKELEFLIKEVAEYD